MTTVRQIGYRNELGELRAWYLEGLAPKLAEAASSGSIHPPSAAALHERLRALLELPPDRSREAA